MKEARSSIFGWSHLDVKRPETPTSNSNISKPNVKFNIKEPAGNKPALGQQTAGGVRESPKMVLKHLMKSL